ncbi:uroporphyrinogen-III C-methyltransferase, partial [bacterium]|nr:uroporphyrinogen-III C-methyltransferase [bacterium]
TIVFLMPLTHLELLTDRIVQSGVFNKDTPAAMISDGTTPAQKSVFGTLGAIAGKVREAKLPSPALLVVGEVCRFGPDLSWFAGVAGHTSPFIHTQPERNHD